MKFLIFLLLAVLSSHADLVIEQNIRALYHDVKLTSEDVAYIKENQDKNIAALIATAQRYISKMKNINDKQKNVVEFTLTPQCGIQNLHFLVRSDQKGLDDLTEEIIKNTQFNSTKVERKMRFVFVYDFYNTKDIVAVSKESIQAPTIKTIQDVKVSESSGLEIQRGSTSFNYSSKEYVREFQTLKDGYISGTTSPSLCAYFRVLTYDNKRIFSGILPWSIHAKISKGKYKLIIKTMKDCDINLQYP